KCKIVVVGDSQCGKTALLHVFAKDCFPENYVPTVFENYTASFEIDTQRIELSLWDTSALGSECEKYPSHENRFGLPLNPHSRSNGMRVCVCVPRVCGFICDRSLPDSQACCQKRVQKRLSESISCGWSFGGCDKTASLSKLLLITLLVLASTTPSPRVFGLRTDLPCVTPDTKPKFSRFLAESCSPYYDNVRPLSYPDSDAVIICFDISRPETLDSVLKKWKGEIQEFCPNTKMLLVGCKSDLRTDLSTLVELSNHRQMPVSYDQGSSMAKQISAPYIECSALQSENSVRDIFHVATLACVNKSNKTVKRNKSTRSAKRVSHMPGRPDLAAVATDFRKDKAKSCTVM
ncbi:rho-related GTP-binding protein RhoE, partial [Silurus meridionalis]